MIKELNKQYKGFTYGVLENTWLSCERGYGNGYIAIPKYHKGYKSFADIGLYSEIEVHGGITYAVPEDNVNIIGFDTAHHGDNSENCDLEYCINECKSVINQIDKLRLYKWFAIPMVLLRRLRV